MGLKDSFLDFIHFCIYIGAVIGVFALLFGAYAVSAAFLTAAWCLNTHFKRWCLGFYKDEREMASIVHIHSEKPKGWQTQEEITDVEWELIGTSEED